MPTTTRDGARERQLVDLLNATTWHVGLDDITVEWGDHQQVVATMRLDHFDAIVREATGEANHEDCIPYEMQAVLIENAAQNERDNILARIDAIPEGGLTFAAVRAAITGKKAAA